MNLFSARKLKQFGGQRGWAAVVFEDAQLAMDAGSTGSRRQCAGAPGIHRPLATEKGAEPSQQCGRRRRSCAANSIARAPRGDGSPLRRRTFQTLQVPTAEKGELKQMLDLQLDNLTPLPAEEVVYDLRRSRSPRADRVLVAVARRDRVNAQVEALELAAAAEVVKVDALAVFRRIAETRPAAAHRELNMLVTFDVTPRQHHHPSLRATSSASARSCWRRALAPTTDGQSA